MGRFDLGRLVESFRRGGGGEVAAIAARFYGGDRLSVTSEEWARCWRLFGPWVVGEQERARTIVNRALNAPGLELMRGFDVLDQPARIDSPTPYAERSARLEMIDAAGRFAWKDAPDRYWPLLITFVTIATRTAANACELRKPASLRLPEGWTAAGDTG